MKNLKIYKRALAVLTASTMVLLTGCMGNSSKKSEEVKKEEQKIETESEVCKHLTIYFEDQPITFKECEGYYIDDSFGSGTLCYDIYKDDELILDGITNQYNIYDVYHDLADEIIEEESVQKVK